MGECLVQLQHRRDARVHALERGHPVGHRATGHHGSDIRHRRRVLAARHQVGSAQDVAHAGPELRLERTDREVATVGAGVQAVAGQRPGQRASTGSRRDAGRPGGRRMDRRPGQRRVVHGHLDVRATTADLRPVQRREQTDAEQRRAGQVGDLHTGQARRAAGWTGHRQHAGVGQVVDVVPGRSAHRAVRAVAGQRGVHQSAGCARRAPRSRPRAGRRRRAGSPRPPPQPTPPDGRRGRRRAGPSGRRRGSGAHDPGPTTSRRAPRSGAASPAARRRPWAPRP